MATRSWIRNLFVRTPRTVRKAPPPRRPTVEALEDRLAPATYRVLTTGDAAGGAITPTGNPNEFTAATFRTALNAANASAGVADTIIFDLPAGPQTITAVLNDTTNPFAFGPTAFVVTDELTIRGDPAEAGVTLSGNDSHRLFGVMAGTTLTLQDLTLTGGRAQGGDGGVRGNNGGGGGGGGAGLGGAVFNNGTLTILNATLFANAAQGGAGGGGLSSDSAGGGGGGAVGGSGGAGSRISQGPGNIAGGGGGGVGGNGSNAIGTAGGAGGAQQDGVTQAAANTNGTSGGGGGRRKCRCSRRQRAGEP